MAEDACDDAALLRPQPKTATALAMRSGREGREKMRRVIRALVLAASIAAVAGCEYLRLQPH